MRILILQVAPDGFKFSKWWWEPALALYIFEYASPLYWLDD